MAAVSFRCRGRFHLVRNFLSVDAPSSLSTEALRTASGTSTSCSFEPSIHKQGGGSPAEKGGPLGWAKNVPKMVRVKYRFGGWFFHETQGTWCGCNVVFFGGGRGIAGCDTHCVCMSFGWLICFFTIGYNHFKCQDCGTMNQEIHACLCGIVVFNWLRPFILRPPLLHKVPGLTLDALDWEAHWWDLSCFIKKIRVEVGHYLNTPQSQ